MVQHHVSDQSQKNTPTKKKSLLVGVISPKAVMANSIAFAKTVTMPEHGDKATYLGLPSPDKTLFPVSEVS
jgi:hypothetical protein